MITDRIGLHLDLPLLEIAIVFTRAAPAFDNLFMRCVININTVHKTVEKLVPSILLKFTFM